LSVGRNNLRPRAYKAGRRVVRWLNSVAPKLVNFGATVLADALTRGRRDGSRDLRPPKAKKEGKSKKKTKEGKPKKKKEKAQTEAVSPRPPSAAMTISDVRFTLLRPDCLASTSAMAAGLWDLYQALSKSGKAYEPMMLACLTRVLQRSAAPSFMDIGAFLGYYACYASALFGGRREVHAIESNPLYANAIRESARVNGFSYLRVFQAPLSDRVESVSIEGLTVRHDGGSHGATTTLDDLCDRERLRPTVIKMDVHGAEGRIVLGMRDTLAAVECMLLEMHNLRWMQEYSPGVTRTALLDALEDAGLTLYYVAGHSAAGSEFEPDFQELLAGRAYSYRTLDRQARDLLLFDRSRDEFVLALRHDDIESLLGPSVCPANE
jgi:FkbM family methyltransferase